MSRTTMEGIWLALAFFALVAISGALYQTYNPEVAFKPSPKGLCLLNAANAWSVGPFFVPCNKASAYPEFAKRWEKEA